MSLSLTLTSHTYRHNMQAAYREHNTDNVEAHAADTHFQSAKLPVTNPGQCQATNKRSCHNTCTNIHTHAHLHNTRSHTAVFEQAAGRGTKADDDNFYCKVDFMSPNVGSASALPRDKAARPCLCSFAPP